VAEHRLSALLWRQAEIRELVRQFLSFPEMKAGERLARTRLAAPVKSAMARSRARPGSTAAMTIAPLASKAFLPPNRNRN
jgi:hypothetical protein